MKRRHQQSSVGRKIPLSTSAEHIFVLAALVGTGAGAAYRVPAFALLATGELGLPLASLGVVNAMTTTVGVVLALVVGVSLRSERPRRRWLVGVFAWLAIGCAILFAAPSVDVLVIVSATVFSAISVPAAILLAIGRDRVAARGEGERTAARVRAALSVGYAVGPLAAAAVLGRWSARVSFLVLAAMYAALCAAARAMPATDAPEAPSAAEPRRVRPGVVTLAVALALMLVVDAYRAGFMAVHATTTLGASAAASAALFAVTGLVNLGLMPLAGALADRFGTGAVLLLGAFFGVAFSFSVSWAPNVVVLAATQILHAAYAACVLAVGLGHAHRVAGSAAGGIAIFQAAQGVAGLLGHLAGGLVAQAWGMASGFRGAAVSCLAGALVLAALRSSDRRARIDR